ncbi:hypothetical protein B7C51_00235 [Paenibacillus larvae subsp. pulvifaciens]|uniref:Uncharacterized protein n=1 Tax=Paenibacillus larvae subsp. pulvifaciens TaxID=1477 RepID=A0A1V0UMT2_9BACL|nr:hypothetical protein [Paenibacillus larvae]ARF66559.1 hypothetical protein B7C51_00235 [Paenibacillus larvae subsp. pulvifaciens]
MFKIETDNGKYTFINDNGIVRILRYGEMWDTGNKAVLSLLQKVEKYREEIIDLRVKAHLSCPGCHDDCQGWVVDGQPCKSDW